MSTVYRGVDTRLDRPVAIKVMSPAYASDPSFLARFEREARLAAGLAHRGVVAVYDQGRDDDAVFLVMELVDGGTLRDLIRQAGALSVAVTMSVLEPLLAALGAAHAAGLVHRDVKPENVLISAKGEVKVADFGLVRAITSQTVATGDIILGTVAYLSPEQVATGAADARSDVYSAGVVAYEMLTGQPPFVGDNAISVAYQHVHSDIPPVSYHAPGVPIELDDLLLAATRRDPLARPRDASAFLSAVVALRARLGLARVAVPVPQPRRPAVSRPVGPRTDSRRTAGPRRIESRPRDNIQSSGELRVEPVRQGHETVGGSPTSMVGTRPTGPARGPQGTAVVATRGPGTVAVDPAALVSLARPESSTRQVGPGGGSRGYPAERAKRSRLRRWIIAIVVILLLGAAAAAGGWWLGSGRWAYTPSSLGVDQQTADGLIRRAGLVPHFQTQPDDAVPVGQVARSDPAPGSRQLRGSLVDLVVSTGQPAVPAITPGTTAAAASAIITAAHLGPVQQPSRDRYDNAVPFGTVIGTEPRAGAAQRIGATVVIVRSKGPYPVSIPDVAGKTVQDAENYLIVMGFTVGDPKQGFDSDVPDGSVIGTVPAADQRAPHGSTVSLVLCASRTVPDVRGQSEPAATLRLEQAGFEVSKGEPGFDAEIDPGLVIGTTPSIGSRVDPTSPSVAITLSNSVVVPGVTGGRLRTARELLTGLGLGVDLDAMIGAGGSSVLSQNPHAGTRVPPGSAVRVTAFP